MRAFEGQKSDRVPKKRSLNELRLQLEELRGFQKRMKPHVNSDLKASVARNIAALERELNNASAFQRV